MLIFTSVRINKINQTGFDAERTWFGYELRVYFQCGLFVELDYMTFWDDSESVRELKKRLLQGFDTFAQLN